MTTRYAICTLTIGPDANSFAKYSHLAMESYARRVGADFIVFDTAKIKFTAPKNFNPILFEKYQITNVLEKYDRALFVDTDILITPSAPNIFEYVPKEKVGGVFEDFGTEKEDRREIIQNVQSVLGDVGWDEGYMNSGVMVLSKEHGPALKLYETYGFFDGQYEQTNTNWYLRKAGHEIIDIDYRFNFMGLMRIYYGPIHREAYFIHYAGGGLFRWVSRLDQMKNDYAYFYEGKNVKSFEDID